jgi:hypothetical protein
MPIQPPTLCSDITGAENGVEILWPNAPVGCIVSQYGTTTFPFCSSPPSNPPTSINIKPAPPTPAPQVIVCVGPGTYQFVISCCPGPVVNAVHTVTVE